MFTTPVKKTPPGRTFPKETVAQSPREAAGARAHSAGGGAVASLDFGRISIYPPSTAQTGAEAPRLQQQLRIGPTDDPLEHEADRIADTVLRMPTPAPSITPAPVKVSRQGSARVPDTGILERETGEAPGGVDAVLRSPGRPLDAAARHYFEPRFGQDFNRVRIHNDAEAAAAARSVNARAFASGHHIVLGDARAAQDHRLLAHELTHVVQQSGTTPGTVPRVIAREPLPPTDRQLGPGPQLPPDAQMIDLDKIEFTQADVSFTTREGITLGRLAKRMSRTGWDVSQPADVVRMNDGRLVSLDHRRLWAAARSGVIKQISARVHLESDLAGPAAERFAIEEGRVPPGVNPRTGDPWMAGDEPATWGDIVRFRSAGQALQKVGKLSSSGFAPTDLPDDGVRDPSFPAEGSKDMPMRLQPGRIEQRIDPTAGGSVIKKGGVRKNVGSGSKPVGGSLKTRDMGSGPSGGDDGGGGGSVIVDPALTAAAEPAAGGATQANAGEARTEPVVRAQVGEPLEPVAEGSVGGSMEAVGGAAGLIQSGLYQSLERHEAEALDARMKALQPFIDPEVQRGNSVEITIVEEAPNSVDLLAAPTGTSDQSQITYFRDAFISAIIPPRGRARQDDNSGPTMRDAGSRPPPSKGGSTLTQNQINDLKPRHGGTHTTFRTQVIPEPSLKSDLTFGTDAPVETPFPKIALARFKPGSEALKHVQFKARDFDDLGTDQLTVGARPPSFYVLKVPNKLRLANDAFGDTPVSFINTTTADGFKVSAVDLDPWVGKIPGKSHTKVLAVFPADERTARLFARTPGTKDNLEQIAYINFDSVRWAYADDVEIVEVYDKAQFKAPDATLPSLDPSDVQSQLAKAPEPVRALYYGLTSKGSSTKASDFLERFLAAVPSDLTDDEVESLTKNLRHSSNVDGSLDSLSQAIQKLRTGRKTSAGGVPNVAPPVASEALAGVVRARMAVVDWSAVTATTVFTSEQKSFFLDDYEGKQGQRVQTFAYGIDEQKRRWGALVTVKVGATAKGMTPVTVISSSALISDKGEALYANSAIWGATLTLQALKPD